MAVRRTQSAECGMAFIKTREKFVVVVVVVFERRGRLGGVLIWRFIYFVFWGAAVGWR